MRTSRLPPPSATLNLAAAPVYIAHAGSGRDEGRVSSALLLVAVAEPLGSTERGGGKEGAQDGAIS